MSECVFVCACVHVCPGWVGGWVSECACAHVGGWVGE